MLWRSRGRIAAPIGIGILLALGEPTIAPALTQPQLKQQETACPQPVLSRLVRHRIARGDTLTSLAEQYNLLPTTLMGMNPSLRQGSVPVGSEILIPPYNGIQVTVPAGSSWRDIARRYNVRPDVLFEANGCQDAPTVVFVPGVNWSPVAASNPDRAQNPIDRYPLAQDASIVRAYGWQVNPRTNAVEFHSGVNLAIESETPVLAVGAGTVAFAGAQPGYGNLVVINHAAGLQTRYGLLDSIAVQSGQQITSGTSLGTIGKTDDAYLHFEVRSNSQLGWVAQDPGNYIPALRIGRSP